MQLDFNPSRFTRPLLLTTFVLAALSWITGPAIDLFGLPHPHSLAARFNLDTEGNFVTWFKSALLFMAALASMLIARDKRKSQGTFVWHWQVLAVAFTLMSIDEVARIHEGLTAPVRQTLHVTGFLYYAWIIPAAALVLAFCALMLRFFLHLPRRFQVGLAFGSFVYVLGALGFEGLGGYVTSTHANGLWYPVLVTLEECAQMIGSVMLLHMLLVYINDGGTVPSVASIGRRSSPVLGRGGLAQRSVRI
jgi:hypothetical protein